VTPKYATLERDALRALALRIYQDPTTPLEHRAGARARLLGVDAPLTEAELYECARLSKIMLPPDPLIKRLWAAHELLCELRSAAPGLDGKTALELAGVVTHVADRAAHVLELLAAHVSGEIESLEHPALPPAPSDSE